MPDKDKEIKDNFSEWATESIMNDQFVSSFSNSILENPVYTISDNIGEKKFYSKQQMLQMFRAGFLSMTNQEFNKKVFEKSESRSESPFCIMKKMSVGNIRIFPYTKWNAARTAAAALKKQFGTIFHVMKITDYRTVGNIKVIRVK